VSELKTTPGVLVDQRLLPERFLIVSNRLPYGLEVDGDRVDFKQGVGGLVTALDPILRHTGGLWIGWGGTHEPLPEKVEVHSGGTRGPYSLKPLSLTRDEVERYYLGYSNKALWPLFHYFQEFCEFDTGHWATYEAINRRFADAIVEDYRNGDLIWIHDYHLMLVPGMIRRRIPQAKIAFFLHIPFPSNEIFVVEPRAEELLNGLLGADLIGFHIDTYLYNFMDCVSKLSDHRYSRSEMRVIVDGRSVRLGSFPISIDFEHFVQMASREEIDRQISEVRNAYRADFIALGVDRLDYSKGIPERLRAIELMLDRHEDIQGKFTFVQLSAPSRTKVEAYRKMREETERMVGHVNGRFGGKGCIPIDYRYQSYSQPDLVTYYRASDLALITPLRDGMNLVAKEYVAAQVANEGMLVLSRFAGAYQELKDAVIVNPYDPETMAEQIYRAIQMGPAEREMRMRRLREVVRRNDIYWWLERCLRAML
jgi:alpha,alpha-trehalose-phosphate synthase [UDP-forming]